MELGPVAFEGSGKDLLTVAAGSAGPQRDASQCGRGLCGLVGGCG